MEKITPTQLLDAVQVKYSKAALLREVTMSDEEEITRWRHALTQNSPYYKRKFNKQGLNFSLDAQGEPIVLPENYHPESSVLTRRIDGLLWEGQRRTAIEVKVSRADFFRESDAKRHVWRKHTHRFIYLTPKGLLKKEEIPPGCGLWEGEITENGEVSITSVVSASLNKLVQPLPDSMTKYFAYRAWSAESTRPPRRKRSRKRK